MFVSYTNQQCPEDDPPGVVVEFVAHGDRRPVAVGATGLVRDGSFLEQMRATGQQFAGGRTRALAGGFGREGVYDVRVETAAGEEFAWNRIRVAGDRCGPFTVVLQAEVTAFPGN